MRRCLLVAAALGVLCSEASAKPREVVRLQPVEPWNLHYADDSCRLARSFGSGKEQVILVLDQFEPGDEFRMMFVGDGLEGRNDLQGSVRFGPNERATKTAFTSATVSKKRALMVNWSLRIAPPLISDKGVRLLDPIGEAREAAATWLELNDVLAHDLILETGSMAKPLAGLRDCSWATVKMWGLDVEQLKTLRRPPKVKGWAKDWVSAADYPPRMVKGSYEAIVNFRLIVDANGKPISCHIQESTRPKEFDDAVCKAAMKRARFDPALDANGRPVKSYWRETVRFIIAG